jgi:hypothetical protein
MDGWVIAAGVLITVVVIAQVVVQWKLRKARRGGRPS